MSGLMTGRAFGVALVAAVVSVGFLEDAGALQRKKSKAKTLIEPDAHDFGAVEQDKKLVHEFTITNEGTEDLEIRRISTSCGCAAAITADRIVGPGETTTLEVTIETRKYKGRIERSISVATNDPKVGAHGARAGVRGSAGALRRSD